MTVELRFCVKCEKVSQSFDFFVVCEIKTLKYNVRPPLGTIPFNCTPHAYSFCHTFIHSFFL